MLKQDGGKKEQKCTNKAIVTSSTTATYTEKGTGVKNWLSVF